MKHGSFETYLGCYARRLIVTTSITEDPLPTAMKTIFRDRSAKDQPPHTPSLVNFGSVRYVYTHDVYTPAIIYENTMNEL